MATVEPDDARERLTRDAVEALFQIAWEDTPREVARSMCAQVEKLPATECDSLLHGLVDTELLADLLAHADLLEPRAHHDATLSVAQMRLVDAALEPLAELLAGTPAVDAVRGWSPPRRARVLFTAVNRSGEPSWSALEAELGLPVPERTF